MDPDPGDAPRYDERHERIQDLPVAHRDDSHPGQDGRRGPYIGHEVLRIGFQCDRTIPPAPREKDTGGG